MPQTHQPVYTRIHQWLMALPKRLAWLLIPGLLLLSCSKDTDPGTPPDPEIPVPKPPDPPTPPLPFTDSLLKVDVYYNGSGLSYNGSYFYEYDSQRRVVGVKENASFIYREDSAIFSFVYDGNSSKPAKCIHFVKFHLLGGTPLVYDTTYFEYDSQGRLIKDSVYTDMWGGEPAKKIKNVRLYSYEGDQKKLIRWFAYTESGEWVNFRKDSIETGADKNCKNWITWIHNDGIVEKIDHWATNKSQAQVMEYWTLRNPFSNLNIAGFPGFWPERGNRFKVLGNRHYPAIYNSNMLPYFLDQGSHNLINNFYFSGWNSAGYMLGSGGIFMGIAPVASSARPAYPSKYVVVGATSYPGDYFEYRFTYR